MKARAFSPLPTLPRLGVFVALVLAFMMALGGMLGGGVARAETAPSNGDFPPLPLCEKGVTNPDGSKRTYQDYALCMAAQIDVAIDSYKHGKYDQAYDGINSAYYDWYENNLEPASMTLPGNRKVKMEGRFTRAKLALKSDPEEAGLEDKLVTIKVAVARDAMVLDGVASKDSPESVGEELLKSQHREEADSSNLNWIDFITAMTLLLREGLEALLVVVAIVLYLVKAGYKKLAKNVYLGALAGVVCSFLLAWVMKLIVGGASQASELIEGITMFIAVAMLFYVSNWMLSKTSGENWSKYIQGMVKGSVSTAETAVSQASQVSGASETSQDSAGAADSADSAYSADSSGSAENAASSESAAAQSSSASSVSSGAAKTLVFAAFIAVLREGAELVLFYTASFAGAGHSPWWVGAGFGTGVILLAVIFVIFRYGGARLPVRPIFMATSILLFVMCISFVGKGVQELKEAGVILGTTNLPWVHHYLPDLGIYPQAETMLPQLILLIASIWIVWANVSKTRRFKRSQAGLQSGEPKNPEEPKNPGKSQDPGESPESQNPGEPQASRETHETQESLELLEPQE